MSDIRVFVRLFAYIFVPLLVAYSTYNFMNRAFLDAMDPQDQKNRLVEIGPNLSFRGAVEKIRDAGIIRYAQALRVLARLEGVSSSIKPGEYELAPSMTPKEVLAKLTEGKVFERRFTANAGATIWEIARQVQEAGLIDEKQFSNALTNAQLLARAGIAAQSFEGYLHPGSYTLGRPIAPDKIIWRMLEEGEKNWTDEYSAKAQEYRYSRHDVLTLASVIQKEAENSADYVRLSSVLHNRLGQGIKLQSEAALVYGLRDFSGQLKPEDYETPSPYNTFLNFGLPQGPVCNPSKEAIDAALNPVESSNLFYLKSGFGNLEFFPTQRDYEARRRELFKSITGQ